MDNEPLINFGVSPNDATEAVQWFVDNGVPLPPGQYHITRPILVRCSGRIRATVLPSSE